MSSDFIQKEFKKVLGSENTSQSMALAVAWIIAHFKGINIKIVDCKNSSSLCDYNIIASAENVVQAKSMIQEIVANARLAGIEIISQEGLSQGEWVLLDLGDVIIHIFQEICRDTYDLDSLWRDNELVKIPNEFYFGQVKEETTTNQSVNSNYY